MFLLKVLEWATTKSEPKDMKLLTLFGRCSHLYFRPFFDRHVKMEDRFRGSRLARCSDGQGPKLKHAMKKSTKGAGRGGRGRSGRGRGGSGRGGAADGGLGAVGGRRGLDALRTLKQRYAERNATGKRCIK